MTRQIVLAGDCLEGMRSIKSGTVTLIFQDSPYNLNIDYGNGPAADNLSDRDFTKFLYARVKEAHRILASNGSIWCLISDEFVCELGVMLKEIGFYRRNHLIVHENFGVQTTKKFARCKRHLLYFVKNEKDFIFNAEAALVPSARLTVYGDKRANPKGKIDQDVFSMTRMCGTFKDRIKGLPTQLPVDLPLKAINVASNPGDLVCDPYVGSGSTAQACLIANGGMRNFIGFELNEKWAVEAQARIDAKKEELTCFAAF